MNPELPKMMDAKTKYLEDTIPTDVFIELNKLSLIARIEEDEERLSELCKKYHLLIKEHL
uniref:Uncharacterized protein n=1 Tax=viral metagenome TaxID=1070528 RepID=A0A6M3LEP8_9ZZZZ